MRILADLEEADVQRLDELAEASKRSRASLIREAISEFLGKKRGSALEDAFGLWGDRKRDGLAYQRTVREEW